MTNGNFKHVVFDCDGTLVDTSGPEYKLYPGMKELILELSPHCLLYVWTARGRSSTLRILEKLGVDKYFDSISTVDDHAPKPHIEGLHALVGHVEKNLICVIGDSSNDMIGAKNFGVTSIGAVWNKDSKGDFLRDMGADFIVSHPSECSTIIRPKSEAE